jgi:ACDE family multidrug resistance protein
MSAAPHGPAASPFKQPKAVFAVAFACVVSFMGIGLVDPILPAISNQLHASPSETTLLFTSYLVVTAVAMLITNWVSSRIGAKAAMIAGLVLIVAFSALAGSSGSISEIIEFRAGWGVGNALFIATSLAVIVASASGGFAGAIVLYETALGLGIAVGPLVGGTLGEISWRGPFYGVSVLMAISLCATVVLVDKTPKPPTKTSLSAPFKALRHRGLLTMALTALCYNWGFFTILGYAPFPMELSPIKLGLVFFGWGIMVAAFAVFGAPWLQRRLGIARTMYANLFIFALISLGIAIWTLNKPALIALVIVSGIVCGVNNTVTTQAVMTVSPVERPVASAAYSFVRFIGGGLAPYAAGRLVLAFNIHLPFYIGAGVILLGIVILSTGHKLLGEAERTQAAAAAAAVGHGATSPEAAAERELEAEEKADALLGDAD